MVILGWERKEESSSAWFLNLGCGLPDLKQASSVTLSTALKPKQGKQNEQAMALKKILLKAFLFLLILLLLLLLLSCFQGWYCLHRPLEIFYISHSQRRVCFKKKLPLINAGLIYRDINQVPSSHLNLQHRVKCKLE